MENLYSVKFEYKPLCPYSRFLFCQEDTVLQLEEDDDIVAISGYSSDSFGWTLSLQAETSAGRSWGPHGYHKPYGYNSLRSSPAASNGLRLNHISGDQTEDKSILRWLHQYNQMKT